MMPKIDKFCVLKMLQANPVTARIPLIVVTAKELTPGEKGQLKRQIQRLLQKEIL